MKTTRSTFYSTRRIAITSVALALTSTGPIAIADTTSLHSPYVTGVGHRSRATPQLFYLAYPWTMIQRYYVTHWSYSVHATGEESSNSVFTARPRSYFELWGGVYVQPSTGQTQYQDISGYYGIHCVRVIDDNAYVRLDSLGTLGYDISIKFGPDPDDSGNWIIGSRSNGDPGKCGYAGVYNAFFALNPAGVMEIGFVEN